MLGVDTNVLVRLLVRDDENQADLALAVLSDVAQKFVIHPIVICELVWVLSAAYKYQKLDIVKAISHIIRVENFIILDKEIVQSALELYAGTSMDFSDAYIAYANKKAGCKKSITFDKNAASASLYKLIS